MRFEVDADGGTAIGFECADTLVSRWVCSAILEGETYPILPFVEDVQVVFDVGANCGAATVHFARHYPDGVVHAFEPASEPLGYLRRNADEYPNVQVHGVGLHSRDQVVPLYRGDGDTILASVVRRTVNLDESEPVLLRAAGPWAAEHAITRIDVLKIDVELCEVDVLASLADLLSTVKVLYIEYDSRVMRRAIARLVAPTHELYAGSLFLDQGECLYVRKDLADVGAAQQAPHAETGARGPEEACPYLPFVDDVHIVWDIAALDRASFHFAALYPGAEVKWFATNEASQPWTRPVDVLHLDVDDRRAGVVDALAGELPNVKVVYFEYGSRGALHSIERAVDDTHELYVGTMQLEQGACIFLRRDLAHDEAATEHLSALVRKRWTARAEQP